MSFVANRFRAGFLIAALKRDLKFVGWNFDVARIDFSRFESKLNFHNRAFFVVYRFCCYSQKIASSAGTHWSWCIQRWIRHRDSTSWTKIRVKNNHRAQGQMLRSWHETQKTVENHKNSTWSIEASFCRKITCEGTWNRKVKCLLVLGITSMCTYQAHPVSRRHSRNWRKSKFSPWAKMCLKTLKWNLLEIGWYVFGDVVGGQVGTMSLILLILLNLRIFFSTFGCTFWVRGVCMMCAHTHDHWWAKLKTTDLGGSSSVSQEGFVVVLQTYGFSPVTNIFVSNWYVLGTGVLAFLIFCPLNKLY